MLNQRMRRRGFKMKLKRNIIWWIVSSLSVIDAIIFSFYDSWFVIVVFLLIAIWSGAKIVEDKNETKR